MRPISRSQLTTKRTAWAATSLQRRRTGYISKDIQFSRRLSKRQRVKKGKLFLENVAKETSYAKVSADNHHWRGLDSRELCPTSHETSCRSNSTLHCRV